MDENKQGKHSRPRIGSRTVRGMELVVTLMRTPVFGLQGGDASERAEIEAALEYFEKLSCWYKAKQKEGKNENAARKEEGAGSS